MVTPEKEAADPTAAGSSRGKGGIFQFFPELKVQFRAIPLKRLSHSKRSFILARARVFTRFYCIIYQCGSSFFYLESNLAIPAQN